MAQPVQGSGAGQVASRPMGSPKRTPTTGQKQLRGKMVNLIMVGSIKRPQPCIVNKKNKEKQEKTQKNREV